MAPSGSSYAPLNPCIPTSKTQNPSPPLAQTFDNIRPDSLTSVSTLAYVFRAPDADTRLRYSGRAEGDVEDFGLSLLTANGNSFEWRAPVARGPWAVADHKKGPTADAPPHPRRPRPFPLAPRTVTWRGGDLRTYAETRPPLAYQPTGEARAPIPAS
ncbi:hypothetical protein CSOJ01_01573 [Colletotrichum sojae]|uniref:Uncharacterized protein n=1 Tax=Colletotrichum sojae TaxID=2175907 RepID=A0A8H6JU72_9PEZI|nr:hypothetical protein CSOJ01_01573 [Colletotrichum sojae]